MAVVNADGAGCEKLISGYCAVVNFFNTKQQLITYGAMLNHSVPRAELMAVVEGLRLVYESEMFFDGISVLILSDCETVVKSARGVAKRSKHKDLWFLYDFYDTKMAIDILHIPRDLKGDHQTCDHHASCLREILKDYRENVFEN